MTLTGSGETATFTPPTGRMGNGEVERAMTLASRDLATAGITNPTPQQTEAALMGGTVTNAQGETTEMPGVLQLRSQGMGWGRIANTIGVHPAQSEQGAARSMRDRNSERQASSFSASRSNAFNRDNDRATAAAASQASTAAPDQTSTRDRDGRRGSAFSRLQNREIERNQVANARAASSSASQASLSARDTGSVSGAAASQTGVRDRGDSSIRAFSRSGDSGHARNQPSRGKDRDNSVTGAVAAGASVSGPGNDRAATARSGTGVETSGPGRSSGIGGGGGIGGGVGGGLGGGKR